MRVTMKDVARAAQVSVTTVSFVLNDAPGIAPETREHVRRVIRELNYTPNDQARRLFSGRAGTIGFVFPPWREALVDPYFIEMMQGCLEAVRDRGYQMLVETADARFLEHRLWHQLYAAKRVDGLLIATPYLDQDYLRELEARHHPALLLNGARPDLPNLGSIGYDDLHCGRAATEHLLGLGHRRIAHIAGPENQASALARRQGFTEVMAEAGLTVPERHIASGQYLPLEARDALDSILDGPQDQWPTAFFCANDTMALSVMTHLRELGFSVPEDFSVVGVDDQHLAGPAGLTTFRQDLVALARRGADLFLAQIEHPGGAGPVRELLPMTFVPRTSCGAPRAAAGRG